MATTVRLLSTYNGYKPQSIITIEDSIATQLIQNKNATLDLTGGTSSFTPLPGSGISSGSNLPPNQTVNAGQTATIVVPAGALVGITNTSDIVGSRETLNPDGTVASTAALTPGQSTIGVFLVDTKIRFNVSFGTLTSKAGVTAGTVDSAPLYTSSATLSNFEDKRGFGKSIEAANTPVQVKRIATTTAGAFLNFGDVNVTSTGSPGNAGDYLRSVTVEVKTMASGGKAGLFLSQRGDTIFHYSTVTTGAVIAAGTAQVLTAGASLVAAQNALSDRVISIEYVPTGGQKQWWTTRIASHNAISGSTVTLVLEDALPDGAAPTQWIIHGPQARRIMEPGRAEGVHTIDVRRASVTGGYVAWGGNGIVSADFYVVTG